MKILLLPASLRDGGTERQVTVLASELASRGHEVSVAVPYAGDRYQTELEAAGVPVIVLLPGRQLGERRIPERILHISLRFVRTMKLIRSLEPDVVHGFGSVLNFYASISGYVNDARVVWGIRDSRPGPAKGFQWIERLLSRRADLTIANSEAGRRSWINRGLPAKRIEVIPNGIDTEKFRIDPEWRTSTRQRLNLSTDDLAIGIIGRTNPVEDHEFFLAAAKLVAEREPRARFMIIGRSSPQREQVLRSLASDLGLDDLTEWVGPTTVVQKYLNALDLVVSSSKTEGFSNVLVEAMACGVPCVATNVGDADAILGDLGKTVESRDPSDLAEAILAQLASVPDGLHEQRRDVILRSYSLDAMATKTENALVSLVNDHTTV